MLHEIYNVVNAIIDEYIASYSYNILCEFNADSNWYYAVNAKLYNKLKTQYI